MRGAFPALSLLALVLAVYGAGLGHAFVWDDEAIVVGDPDTANLRAIGGVLLSPDEVAPYYRPLNRASYLIDHALFGMDPRGFHAVNLALHAASVLALYAVGRRLFADVAAPWTAAALLAVHPIHAEAVNFVTARNNLFALLFSLLAFAAFLDADRDDSRASSVFSACAFLLALASKEPALMVLPLMAAWPRLRGMPPLPSVRRSATLLWPHALALLVYLAARAIALAGATAAATGGAGVLRRLSWNLVSIPRYLGLVVFPGDLTVFHPTLPSAGDALAWVVPSWIAIGIAAIFLSRRASIPVKVGTAWFVLQLVPIAHLVPIPSAAFAERYFHAAAVGIWIVAADLARLLPGSSRVRAATVAAVLLLLSARSAVRTLDWRDDVSLFQAAVAVDPRSAVALENLGTALKDRGDLSGARSAWERALRAQPGRPTTLVQLGTLAAVSGDLAEAERLYLEALRRDPAIADAWLNLARVYERTGRPAEAARARARGGSGPSR
ncbi:MAG TPA: tetratricopeptide repeat protein [Candidatus Polarisedimenticolaceae bacterium]